MLFAAIETVEKIFSYFLKKRIFERYSFLPFGKKNECFSSQTYFSSLVLAIKTHIIMLVVFNKRTFIFVLWLEKKVFFVTFFPFLTSGLETQEFISLFSSKKQTLF